MAIFQERTEGIILLEMIEPAGDEQIMEKISRLSHEGRVAVGMDAPLSYNPGGGDRASDKALRDLVKQHAGGVGVMTPTMTRMVYLTLRGIALTRMLAAQVPEARLVEVHPGACMLLRDAAREDVKKFKTDVSARARLLDWLSSQGLKGLTASQPCSDHFVAACAAALGAWQWAIGKAVWCHPAEPPAHPYDFAC